MLVPHGDIQLKRCSTMYTLTKKGKLAFLIIFLLVCLYSFRNNHSMTHCQDVLKQLSLPKDTLILDLVLLKSIDDNDCIFPEKVVVALPTNQELSDLSVESLSHYDLYLYEQLKEANYIKFYPVDHSHSSVKAIPIIKWRKFGAALIPENIPQFLQFWQRSKLIECRNYDIQRDEADPYIDPREAIGYLAHFQKLLLTLDMYPFLVFGTLLGWYRECGIIPHTGDVDISVMAEEYNPHLFDILRGKKHGFRLTRQFGRPNNNFEMTVAPQRTSVWFTIDLFLMYSEGKEKWMGGTGNDGTRIHFVYPSNLNFCAADLYGHLFWVTCSPELMIQLDYGKEWYKDSPSETFEWWNTPNARDAGTWEQHELNETVRIFELPPFLQKKKKDK